MIEAKKDEDKEEMRSGDLSVTNETGPISESSGIVNESSAAPAVLKSKYFFFLNKDFIIMNKFPVADRDASEPVPQSIEPIIINKSVAVNEDMNSIGKYVLHYVFLC